MNNLGTVQLETERLILRKFTHEDAEQMFSNWASDPEVTKYTSWDCHKNVEETKEIIKKWIDSYKENSYNWVIELRETKEIIGSITGVKVYETSLDVEIGYCYGQKYWNKGYASEALRKVIDFFINECGVHLVSARHMSDNPASGRVMIKAGMKYEATLRDRVINKETKEFSDLLIYSIIKDELS